MENIKMKQFIFDKWNVVMCHKTNPLSNIKNIGIQHMVMQLLAWMWSIVFALAIGSWTMFGYYAIAHVLIIGAIVITVATFETAKKTPTVFGRASNGEHE
tara:strand:+ start:4049 stop:4348 length:300 start_codon:yes stop_codon:yes gene_type:complete